MKARLRKKMLRVVLSMTLGKSYSDMAVLRMMSHSRHIDPSLRGAYRWRVECRKRHTIAKVFLSEKEENQ